MGTKTKIYIFTVIKQTINCNNYKKRKKKEIDNFKNMGKL